MATSTKLKISKYSETSGGYFFKTHSGDDVFIGDYAETKFKPLLWLKRWSDECHIKLPVGKTVKNFKFDEENNCIVWDSDLFTVKVYPSDKTWMFFRASRTEPNTFSIIVDAPDEVEAKKLMIKAKEGFEKFN